MKKIIALLLALCMVCSACCFALAEETEGLKDARSYINLMYKKKPASTPKDYELIGSVPGDDETYTVEWTTDSDTIAITRLDSGMVKIDVDENNPKLVEYKLTATIKDAAGNEISISFDRFVPAAINLDIMTEEEIVEVAYGMDDGAALPTPTVLTGTIVAIPSAYSEQYDNITVNIQIGDLADQPIQCYRLQGGSSLQIGDKITVLGTIKNYKGTIEFDKGCYTIEPEYAQSARVALFAYSLEDGAALSHASTVTGVILAIPSAYSADYGNITVNIGVPGLYESPIQCYRLTGGEDLAEGDIITVTGTIKNYKGTIEFDKGCTYVKYAPEAVEEEAAEVTKDEVEKALEELEAQFSGDVEDGDFDAFLTELMGLLGTENGNEESSEGAEDFLSSLTQLFTEPEDGSGEERGLLDGLSGLLGSFTDESGEGVDILGSLSGLLGSFTDESGEEGGLLSGISGLLGSLTDESGEEGGLLSGLSGLLGSFTDESGEGADIFGSLSGLLGSFTDESGEGADILGSLSGMFRSFADESTEEADLMDTLKLLMSLFMEGEPDREGKQTLRLGTSGYTILCDESFAQGDRTEEEIADDMVAYMKSPNTLLDFDIYQFSKEGYPETLADFVNQEAKEYNAFSVTTELVINGIPAGLYLAQETYDGVEYTTATFAFEDGGQYVEIAFWLDGDEAIVEAMEIIATLTYAPAA